MGKASILRVYWSGVGAANWSRLDQRFNYPAKSAHGLGFRGLGV